MNTGPVVTKRLKPFNYFSPATIAEATSILEDHGPKAVVLAGGTDLLSMMKLRAVLPEAVVSLTKIDGLNFIREEDGNLKIGALTPIAEILASDLVRRKYPCLHEATRNFATPQIRNMATIGGNVCRSSPSGDTLPPLMALEADLLLAGPKGQREVPVEAFFTGPGLNVLDREILTEITLPRPGEQFKTAFLKLTRNSSDLAKVNCAVTLAVKNGECSDVKIVLGAVAGRPVRARQAEQALKGQPLNDETVALAAEKVVEDIDPISDARSTAAYRTQVSKVLAARAIRRAAAQVV